MSYLLGFRNFLFWFLSICVAVASVRFLLLPQEIGLEHMWHQVSQKPVLLYVHILVSPIALAIVPFQFSKRLRLSRPRLHRWLGRVYGMAILFGGVSGLLIAPNAQGGLIGQSGFFLLAVLWLATTATGIWQARQRAFASHQIWMIRSAALTWAAVTLRLYLPLLTAGFGFETGYMIVAWLCWVPNLLVAEWLVRRVGQRRVAHPLAV